MGIISPPSPDIVVVHYEIMSEYTLQQLITHSENKLKSIYFVFGSTQVASTVFISRERNYWGKKKVLQNCMIQKYMIQL